MDPSDPNTLYAAAWERQRRHWNDPRVEPGFTEGGVFKTTDGGKNWTRLTNGLPPGNVVGRIGIAIAASNPKVVYAFIDNYDIDTRPGGDGIPLAAADRPSKATRFIDPTTRARPGGSSAARTTRSARS